MMASDDAALGRSCRDALQHAASANVFVDVRPMNTFRHWSCQPRGELVKISIVGRVFWPKTRDFEMSIEDAPYFEIPASELAAWIEDQGQDHWWTVDGDPELSGRISFPCPGDELAAELRRIGKPLLVADQTQQESEHGKVLGRHDLDRLAGRLGNNLQIKGSSPTWVNDRLFFLSWKGSPTEWLLIEDEETSESSENA